MSQEITFFAKTNFRNQQRVFGIKTDDRRRHMYVIGKTGMGKTNLLENLVIQDIQHGHGVAFIDPHGDTAEKIIKAIPASRINDVIYFNPADQEFPLAFNVMESVNLEHRHLVASGLVGVFKKIWADSWGPRLEYILRNAILALLEYPGSTLLGVTRILVDKEYRKRVVDKVTDPVVKSFWVDEFTKWNDRVLQEVIAPIQNKVGQFLSSSLIRNIVGQTKSSFDVREAMDAQKILILNLAKGRIGEDNSALLGAMMITKIQLAAMGRVDIEEEDRKDFYLYVDEFQNFATESFANILSEARKYRLSLILANQYVSQVDEKVRDAIFGNAGTIISFRVGAADAEFLEKEFEPVFMVNDLVNLPKFNVYLKLMIDGVAGDAFSATVLPPIELRGTVENIEKVIRISRERYTSKKQDVEDKIRRWTGMLTEEEKAILVDRVTASRAEKQASMSAGQPLASSHSISQQKSPVSMVAAPLLKQSVPTSYSNTPASTTPVIADVAEKPLYIAYCAVCDTEINVPFKPDGKRPTFCRDHLKEYQRTAAKVKEDIQRNSPMQQSVTHSNALSRPLPVHDAPQTTNERSGVRISTEKPLSLSQMEHTAPKKFMPAPSLEKLPSSQEALPEKISSQPEKIAFENNVGNGVSSLF
jgi:CxxC-x17-CxxC domain-containing protein